MGRKQSNIGDDKLGDQNIAFIPNQEFESTEERDFAEIDFELYAAEDRQAWSEPAQTAIESFLSAVEQSRILTVEGERFLFKRLNFLRFRASALQAASRGTRTTRKTRKEIERLLEEANATREQIACANLRLVTSIVRRLAGSQEEFDEFLSEAHPILLNAIDKFDYGRGYRFSTYATHAVQRHTYRVIQRVRKRRQQEQSGKEEVFCQVPSGASLSDAEEARKMASVEAILKSLETTLDEREQFIVRARFGLDGTGKGKSMRAIGDEIGLSKERVRQLLHESVEKLASVAEPLESSIE